MVTPRCKLHFIDHPRYGKVYPIITHDFRKNYFTLPVISYLGLGAVNTVVLYGTFISQVFTPMAQSFLCNPLFILPSLYANYVLFDKYYVYFFGGRSHIQNMFLKTSGKSVIVETRDGASTEIKNNIFYHPKQIKTGYEDRIDIGYGANKYLFIKGNPLIKDMELLEAVLLNKQVDVNNIAYDYDVSNEFTWKFREIVEIKKQRRPVVKYHWPTAKSLLRLQNIGKFNRASQSGSIKDRTTVVKDYVLYAFNEEVYSEDTTAPLPGEFGEIKPGDPLYVEPVTPALIERQNKRNQAIE